MARVTIAEARSDAFIKNLIDGTASLSTSSPTSKDLGSHEPGDIGLEIPPHGSQKTYKPFNFDGSFHIRFISLD